MVGQNYIVAIAEHTLYMTHVVTKLGYQGGQQQDGDLEVSRGSSVVEREFVALNTMVRFHALVPAMARRLTARHSPDERRTMVQLHPGRPLMSCGVMAAQRTYNPFSSGLERGLGSNPGRTTGRVFQW